MFRKVFAVLWLGRKAIGCQKDDEYKLNESAYSSLQQIAKDYEFDYLEVWPCCGDCGKVLFVRVTEDQVQHTRQYNDDGSLSNEPVNGVTPEED